jgi:hypothetical protein
MQSHVDHYVVNFACSNLHHFLLDSSRHSKKSLSKTTINNSGDSGSSFSYHDNNHSNRSNRSMSPSKSLSHNNTQGSDEGKKESSAKFVFKKDL